MTWKTPALLVLACLGDFLLVAAPRLSATDVRAEPGGKRLLFVDGNDIRPEIDGPCLYFLDGPALSLPQLTAVLSLLKPALFNLPPQETVAKQKERADKGAEADATATTDPWIATTHWPDKTPPAPPNESAPCPSKNASTITSSLPRPAKRRPGRALASHSN